MQRISQNVARQAPWPAEITIDRNLWLYPGYNTHTVMISQVLANLARVQPNVYPVFPKFRP